MDEFKHREFLVSTVSVLVFTEASSAAYIPSVGVLYKGVEHYCPPLSRGEETIS